MSETLGRIQETGAACIAAYEAWNSEQKNVDNREALQETLHELRKAVARIEIEIATSERDAGSSKKIPVPTHRSQSKSGDGSRESILPDREQNNGNGGKVVKKSSGRRTRSRKPSDG
ncbi:MAG: hypothetical protein CMH31_00415 [Micavibrio sp.]|nr:hypothetical protein [Micavibrio sp.]|tara:strand:+ start:307 stop:657 length:351 start_codon:yes stop_codon:yes gene_type:complete